METLLDHLLRTFAAVPHTSRILDLGCGQGTRAGILSQLGFDLYACDVSPEAAEAARTHLAAEVGEEEAERRVTTQQIEALEYPDMFFDWVVAFDVFGQANSYEELIEDLAETRRVLKDGGWVYLTVPAVPEHANPTEPRTGYAGDSGLELTFTTETLDEVMAEAGFAVAQQPQTVDQDAQQRVIQGIYRRVDEDTPV